VVNEPGRRAPAGDRHLERVDDELRAHVVGERPTDHPPREAVDDGRQVKPPLPGPQIGDVRDPEPVGRSRAEVALNEIGGTPDARHPDRGPAFAALH
jgi:hypothetical protein